MTRLCTFFIFAISLFVFSQAKSQSIHEFSVHGGAGFSGLTYSPAQGALKNGFGGKVGLGYTYFFTPSWGLHTGVEVAFYNRTANVAHLMDSTLQIYDWFGAPEDMYFKYEYTNYKEQQRVTYLQIPIMAQFQHPAFNNHQWYVSAGVKLGFVLDGSYKSTGNILSTTGFLPAVDQYLKNVPNRGFGDYTAPDYHTRSSGKLDFLTFNTSLSAEGGIKWRLADHWHLYTGLYLDYGLNNIAPKHKNIALVIYQSSFSTAGFDHSSLLNSTHQIDQTVFNKSIHSLAAGINIRITFGAGNIDNRRKKLIVPEEEDNSIEKQSPVDAKLRKAKAQRVAEELAALRLAEEKALQETEQKRKDEEKIRKEELESLQSFTINNYQCAVTNLTESQEDIMAKNIAILLKYPDVKITVEGHTCDLGSDEVNMGYGKKRAEEVKGSLVEKGIAADRISAVSYGESMPVVPNSNEANRRINRRVEVIINK